MIAEGGLAALWLAAALSLLQLIVVIAALKFLPASEARGKGDRLKGGGGASSPSFPRP